MATTTSGATTGTAVERLKAMMGTRDRFDYAAGELRELQVAAIDERLQERRATMPLVAYRAREAGISEIRSLEDVVPLLFPHTAYKSYPESFLLDGRWDRLTKWLRTVSPYQPPAVDASEIADLDAWMSRMKAEGIFVSCSSGTTGSPALLPASQRDLDWTKVDCVTSFTWATGVEALQDRRLLMLAAVPSIPRNDTVINAQTKAFGDPAAATFRLPMPPITIAAMTKMVMLRRKMTEGRAMPEEIAEFERTSAEREEILERAMVAAAEAIVEHREEKLMFMGYWAAQYRVATLVREMGYGAKDLNPENCIWVAGGTKRAQLPPDYQEFVYETWNIPAERHFQAYGMQEINSTVPRCRQGRRYHLPAWLVPLVLNRDGDALVPHEGSEVEGRAAFFDLALDGRWGGVISGDMISLDYGPCACGNASPSIRDDIVRYADLEGDDKIGCAGTVDAYVRGLS